MVFDSANVRVPQVDASQPLKVEERSNFVSEALWAGSFRGIRGWIAGLYGAFCQSSTHGVVCNGVDGVDGWPRSLRRLIGLPMARRQILGNYSVIKDGYQVPSGAAGD